MIDPQRLQQARKLSVAPMMNWTDRHCRYFHRLLHPQALLYTEMVTTGAILHGDRDYHLQHNPAEHPLALQLGGSDPKALALCASIAEDFGYNEVNLNCGCPSDRVQNGAFGACLMKTPQLVAECFQAMQSNCQIPVTIKCRIGVDDLDQYEHLQSFTQHLYDAGCKTLIVHARKAWLQGLSPKQNREIPPLHYHFVHQLKQDFPTMEIIINGGINSLEVVEQQLQAVDGVMIGRSAYQTPWLLAQLASADNGSKPMTLISPMHIYHQYIDYCTTTLATKTTGLNLHHLTRHIMGLFQGVPGARGFRRLLSEQAHNVREPEQAKALLLKAAAGLPGL